MNLELSTYGISGVYTAGVSVVPCAVALVVSLCILYLSRVYRRRLHYIKTRLDEATSAIYVTADDQSQADNLGHTDTGSLYLYHFLPLLVKSHRAKEMGR